MTQLLLFHHAQGLTEGVRAFAQTLRSAGHSVAVPDLYEGATFATLAEGMKHLRTIGFDAILSRSRAAADGMPEDLVYAGFSLGSMSAQMLAQTRPGAVGALLVSGCVPASEFGAGWPRSLPLQVHGMDADPEFALSGDLDAARELVDGAEHAELFVYPGDKHLFADSSLPDFDVAASALLTQRVLAFLDDLD